MTYITIFTYTSIEHCLVIAQLTGCPTTKSCGKGSILELYIEKEGIVLLLEVIIGQTVKSEV